MAVNNEYPLIDGYAVSWADIAVKASGDGLPLIELADIKAINSGATLEIGFQEGATGGRPKKRGRGRVTYDASLTLYRSGAIDIYRRFLAVAPRRGNEALVGLVHFNITIMQTLPDDSEVYERRIYGARMLGNALSQQDGGTDVDAVEIPLSTIKIADIVDGVEVVLL